MSKLTASDLVSFINQLNKKNVYNYPNPKNKAIIKIVDVTLPEGPIKIKRWDPSKGGTEKTAETESISIEMIWRIANSFYENLPININCIFGKNYHTRSVLEALILHTPQFYTCRPGRIKSLGGNPKVKEGHKHIIWKPNDPHKAGNIFHTDVNVVISEVPSLEVVYDAIVLPEAADTLQQDIDIQRRHSQIQVALLMIGVQLGYRVWIAQNDKGIVYQNKKIAEHTGVIQSLADEKILSAYSEAQRAALLVDCIWFKNGRLMPAMMEVEHSTGVTSGLSRMLNFQNNFIELKSLRYVIVAPDEDRERVFRETNKEQFRSLDARFFPYSAVEELYALCQKRKLRGITEDFLDCYMEPTILNTRNYLNS